MSTKEKQLRKGLVRVFSRHGQELSSNQLEDLVVLWRLFQKKIYMDLRGIPKKKAKELAGATAESIGMMFRFV